MLRKCPSWIAVVTIAVLVSSCASMKERANEKILAGNFDEAAALFERAVQQDPNDAEAVEGLKRARAGILGKRLIEVRQARTAGNQAQALDQLLAIVDTENRWKQSPAAEARFTQEEEIELGFAYFKQDISSLLQQKKPLLASYRYRRYQPVFSAEKTAKHYTALETQIERSGKESCNELWKEAGAEAPYYTGFLSSYCQFWKIDKKMPAKIEQARVADLFSTLELSGSVQQLPAELQAVLRQELQEAFESSPWHHPRGPGQLKMQLAGNYSFSHAKNLVSVIHYYDASEPYEDFENVTKTRDIPYTVMESVIDPVTKQLRTVQVTKYRKETYQEKEKVVRHRMVKKAHPYSALRHQQSIELSVAANGQVGSRSIAMTYLNKANAQGDEHELSVPDIGLNPSRPQLLNPAAWVKSESPKLQAELSRKLSEAWISRFCTPGAGTRAELGELVQKCRRDKKAGAPAFINDWYQQNFGLTAGDAERLLGLESVR